MQRKKMILWAVVVLLVIGIAYGVRYFVELRNYRQGIADIHVQNIDLSAIPDGEYFGDCDVDFIRARVRVLMKDGKMQELELLEHYNDRGEAANVLPSRMLEEQRIDVDTISGATSSCKVIQQAVYNALVGERAK